MAKDELKDFIPKGYTLYGEIVGYTETGTSIQKGYDYGCSHGEHKLYIYRITVTNSDNFIIELTDTQIKEFCEKYGLNYSDTFFAYDTIRNWIKKNIPDYSLNEDVWREQFIKALEDKYTEKYCFMCTNKVPEEGIVLRKENLFNYEAYKLKSFKFYEWETKQLDNEETNLEDLN